MWGSPRWDPRIVCPQYVSVIVGCRIHNDLWTVFTTQGWRKDSKKVNRYEMVDRRDMPVCNSDSAHMHR